MPSVLWRCWLVVRKSIRPVNIEWWGVGEHVVICLEQVADCLHMVQLIPLPFKNSRKVCLQWMSKAFLYSNWIETSSSSTFSFPVVCVIDCTNVRWTLRYISRNVQLITCSLCCFYLCLVCWQHNVCSSWLVHISETETSALCCSWILMLLTVVTLILIVGHGGPKTWDHKVMAIILSNRSCIMCLKSLR